MGGYDGEIRIKTSMELKQLDKDIKEAEKMLREYEKESERLAKERAKNKAEIEAKQQEAMEVGIKRNRIKDILDKRAQSGQSTDTGIYGDLKLEYAQLDETYKRLSGEIIELENKTKQAMDTNQNNIKSTKEEIGELANKYNQAKQELLQYNEQLEQQKKREQEVKDIKRSIDNVGNSVKRVTGQMIRWSLSLVGINGMMSLVSRSLTLLKNDNKELNANLNYISFALANAIKPIVEKIVNLVLTLMQYVNYIWVKWFGHNLFKDSGAKEYEKSMKNSSKSAKQIRKDIMVFDEVNKLSDDSSSSADSGFVAPSIDLSKVDNIDVPKWVKWIADHKDDILRVCDALMALLVFKKTIEWLKPLTDFFGMFSNGNIANNLGLTGGQLGLIVGSLVVIAGSIYKIKKDMDDTYEKVKQIYDIGDEELDDWLKQEHDVDEVNDRINQKKEGQLQTEKDIAKIGHTIAGNNKDDYQILKRNLTQQDKLLLYKVEQWRQGKLTKEEEAQLVEELGKQRDEVERVAKAYEPVVGNTQDLYDMSSKYKDILGEIGIKVDDTNRYMDYSVDNINRFGLGAEKSKNSLVSIADKFGEIANTNLPDKNIKVNVEADTSKAQNSLGKMVSSIAQNLTNAITKIDLSSLIDKFANMFNGLNKFFGFKIDVSNIKKKLGLRQGGIIHNPGRGVALGSNIIGGEGRNAEAVLPLDDTTMDRLGQSIARHMTINATMINQMNGRTLSREVKQIMSENNFANNI